MKYFFSCIIFFLPLVTSAQSIPVNDNNITGTYSFIHPALNRITDAGSLDSFYNKLYQLKTTHKGVISVVHIGDSHIQADFLPGIVRAGLQQFFGNAGRGLVFPYQLAQSNAPPDIGSSSNISWEFNRLAHPEIPITAGISGYSIQTITDGAAISISLKPVAAGPQTFNYLKFFVDSNTSNSWMLETGNNQSFLVKKNDGSSLCREITLPESTNSFSFSSLPSGNTKEFYGVSLENSNPGVLYHVIGVNGARYDQFNIASLFWKQLAALNADLFIISLGTNEAQRVAFAEKDFWQQVSLFIQKLKMIAPGASVLITTPADSYKGRKPNAILKQISFSLVNYCHQNHIAAWDLYRITGGYGSAYSWMKRKLMNRDRVHFTADGYHIQGSLLFNALSKGYNSYINSF
ncbi:MAG: GDSL-type esterase/lipase family protein [Bacteroidota bacterium]|nr:GDSL-type esterase/lipase family protein [Bacteroidota bacterium]